MQKVSVKTQSGMKVLELLGIELILFPMILSSQ